MAIHNETGKQGEEKAARWLRKRDFEILERNWRCGHLEIDIIATKDQYLHFIEVKTRTSNHFGYPEEEVSRGKLRHMIDAGVAWLALHHGWKRVRYDILAIRLNTAGKDEYLLIEDVYL
ncbi:MAG: YraN family protein [Chitinophagaceae bacterium]|jgi:putative endonuclease|nr:YraN family protein [Chitinophagaceae bacterium]